LKDAHQDTEQGAVKEDVGEKILASGRTTHQRGCKICRGQKTVEGRYATLQLEDGTRRRRMCILYRYYKPKLYSGQLHTER